MEKRTHVLGMPVSRFLREHWQKKPLLVRSAFPDFVDPITPDELAGLSCEDGVESRIVREKGWEITWGPQEEAIFATLPDTKWTILVQELNRHVPDAALLLEPFSFIPNVRVDDVMVSYAAPGGSVGAHLDSYDVFLVQGQGERRWQWGTKPAKDRRFREGLELRILERFVPDADEVLGPGDMLYLPPGFAHHGVAESACLTYSIGFRSPSFAEMHGALAFHVARKAAVNLLVDPPLSPPKNAGAIPRALLANVRNAVRSLAPKDDDIDRWFASFATMLKAGHELTPPARAPSGAAIWKRLATNDTVSRSEEGRWAFLPRPRGALLFYVAGVEIPVSRDAAALAQVLCTARRFEGRELAALASSEAARALIVRLFEMGGLRFGGRFLAKRRGGASER